MMDDPKKAQLQKRLIAVMLLIFAGSLANALRGMGLFKPAPTPSPSSSAPAMRALPATIQILREKLAGGVVDEAPTAPAGLPSAQPPRASYTAGSLRDPFQSLLLSAPKPVTPTTPGPAPVAAPQPVAPTLPPVTIQGVVWGDPQPRAIIDNDVYRIGDTVGGAVITAIGRGGVTVEIGGHTMRLGVAQGVMGGPTTPQLPPPQMRRR